MSTQPLRGRRRTPPPTVMSRILILTAGAFVVLGALSLHFAAPAKSLTPLHLIALVAGWSASWGSSYLVLHKTRPEADPFILPVVALLTGWGLLIIARLAPGFLLRQILWLAISCAALCSVALVPIIPRLLRRYRYSLLAGGLLLLGATLLFGVNPSGFGQRLWLGAFGIYFQPSELLKLLLVIYLASYLSDRRGVLTQACRGQAPMDRRDWPYADDGRHRTAAPGMAARPGRRTPLLPDVRRDALPRLGQRLARRT